LIALLVAAIGGAVVYRLARIRAGARPSLTRTAISALAGALLGMLAHWVSGSALVGVAAVVIAFGIPAGMWQLYKTRRLAPALAALVIWGATALPAVILTSAL
jgi:Flp pilus assembly protein TadB